MNLTPIQRKQLQRVLVAVLGGVLLFTSFILWQGFFAKTVAPRVLEPIAGAPSDVKINFEVLRRDIFKDIVSPPAPTPFPDQVGRTNPFVPLKK